MSTPFLGEIRMFGFARIPTGWLPCNGSLMSIANNDALYTLLGTAYGGDGVNTFGLPDLRGQTPVHQGTGPGLTPRPLGLRAGNEAVTLISSNLPTRGQVAVATPSVLPYPQPKHRRTP